jgi:hypothetical protein
MQSTVYITGRQKESRKAEKNLNTAFTMTEARAFRMLGTHWHSERLGGKQGYSHQKLRSFRKTFTEDRNQTRHSGRLSERQEIRQGLWIRKTIMAA